MKAEEVLMVLTCSVMALLMTPELSAAIQLPAGELEFSSFKLQQQDGYGVQVSGLRLGKRRQVLAVSVQKRHLSTSYSIPTPLGPRLRGTFGSLGQLDVRFERRKRRVERPEKGCRWIVERGIFRGSFSFVGEEAYFSRRAVNPQGEVLRLPDGFCGLGDFRTSGVGVPGIRQTILETSGGDQGRTISFAAFQLEFQGQSDPPASFEASLRERIEEMTIERLASADAPAATFSHSGTSHATVEPPAPFVGTAELNESPDGPATWSGSLAVSFLGAPQTPLVGEAFRAKLCPRVSISSSCLP